MIKKNKSKNDSEKNLIIKKNSSSNSLEKSSESKDLISNNTDNYINEDIITPDDFKIKEKMFYNMIINFFKKCNELQIQLIIDIINGNHIISLRFLDWFITRYCFLYKICINVDNEFTKEDNFNISISYKANLKSYKKKYFDTFRRKKKFFYKFEKLNLVLLTTIGQLNLFRWCLYYDIINYVIINYKSIISKMNHVNSYFKKNIIENTSFSNSDETNDNDNPDIQDLSLDSNNSSDQKSNNSGKIIKSKASYNPKVTRNICIEF